MNSRKYKFIFLLILAYTVTVYAADYYSLSTGNNQEITEHTVCSKVRNTSGKSVFIPTKTSGEWSAFRSSTAVANIVKEACIGIDCSYGETELNCYNYGTSGPCNAAVGCLWMIVCRTECSEFGTSGPCNDAIGCVWDGGVCSERCLEYNGRPSSVSQNCSNSSICGWDGGYCSGGAFVAGCEDDPSCAPGDCSCYITEPLCEGDPTCDWFAGVCNPNI